MKKKTLVVHSPHALRRLAVGVEKLAAAVAVTLGPRGRNVAIAKEHQDLVVHDGVTVARNVWLADPVEALGANIVKQAAEKTVAQVGDCTTGTVVLAAAVFREIYRRVLAGENPMIFRKTLEEQARLAGEKIQSLAVPVADLQRKIQVASISAEDEMIGRLVGETLHEVGLDGVVTVDKSDTAETFVEKQEGLQIDQGYLSPYFVTHPQDMTAVLEGPRILVTNRHVNDFLELTDFLNRELLPRTRVLLVIAPEIGGSALPSFIANKLEGKLQTVCIKAPGHDSHQDELLRDLAVLTGATYISHDTGRKLSDLKFTDLGFAAKVVAGKDSTVITGPAGDPEQIRHRIAEIKTQLKTEASSFRIAKLQERLAKLTGGVAVVRVGGHTEIEFLEKKERAIDAVEATKAAMRGGVVAGGEVTLLRVGREVGGILGAAMQEPFRKLLENAGLPAEVMREKVLGRQPRFGVDVLLGDIVDMFEAGIVDPAEVLISAINNAVSVAVQIATTEVVIAYDEVPDLQRKS